MPDWDCVNGFGEEGGDPDFDIHDPHGHCGPDFDDVVGYMARQGWNGPRSKVYRPPLACKQCKSVNVYWQNVRGQHRLFSTLTAEQHVCPISDSAFDIIPED